MLAPSLLSFDWWMSFCSKIICILLFWALPDLLMTIANGSRTRWKDFLFPVQRVSLEAFQLCALAKTQQWNPHSPPAIIITVKHFSKGKDLFQNQNLNRPLLFKTLRPNHLFWFPWQTVEEKRKSKSGNFALLHAPFTDLCFPRLSCRIIQFSKKPFYPDLSVNDHLGLNTSHFQHANSQKSLPPVSYIKVSILSFHPFLIKKDCNRNPFCCTK